MATLKAREYKHAVHMKTHNPDEQDLHLIKETLHLDDGTLVPNVKLLENFKRPFYITKKSCQDHKEKKEWESVEKLQKYECTESELRNNVAKALGVQWSRDTLRQLAVSPYLYGTDVDSKTHLKALYRFKYDVSSLYTVSFFDVETDTIKGHKEIIIATVVYNRKVFTVCTKAYLEGIACPELLLNNAINKLSGDVVKSRNYGYEFVIADNEIEVVKAFANKLHEWKPDLVAIWNIDFDIPKVVEACERAGIDPKDIFSDPIVPPSRRHFKYRQGPKQKVAASGKKMPINPAAQWHSVDVPASFFFIDGMCAYKLLRLQKQEESSYSLDNILKVEKIPVGKLKIPEAEQYVALKWHQFMQTCKKIEYIVYNQIDCISFQMLNEKTNDLSSSLPTYSQYSDFYKFNSQPKRIVDGFYFYALQRGNVLGTVAGTGGNSMNTGRTQWGHYEEEEEASVEESEEELSVLGLDGWIITLQSHNTAPDVGLNCIEEDPDLIVNIRGLTYDSDATSAYPSATTACNVSKETTKLEIIDIEGIEKYRFKMENINLLSGPVNASEYCQVMFNFPNYNKLLESFNAEM